MSFLSNVGNIFRPVQQVNQVQAAPAPAQAPQAPAAPKAPEPLAIQNNSMSPADISQVANTPTPTVPLDEFKDLWQTPANATPQADPWAAPVVNYDQANMAERVRSMDFTQGIDPGLAQQALQGDPASLMKLINGAAQNAFQMSTQLSAATTNSAATQMASRIKDYVPQAYKEQQLREAPAANPMMEHPAFAPMVQATRAQIARQNPQLTTAQINEKANAYFDRAFSQYGSNSPQGQAQQAAPAVPVGQDFENW